MKQGFIDKLIEKIDRLHPTEAQKVMTRLVAEKGFLQEVFDSLSEGVIVVDEKGIVLYSNQASSDLLGISADDSEGKSIEQYIDNWDRYQKPALEGKIIAKDVEVFYPENRILNIRLTPLKNEEVEIGFSVILIRDITKDQKLTAEKIESERLSTLTTLAAGVAHELGNPLNSLTIHLQLIDRKIKALESLATDELGEMLGVAQGELKRLGYIIDEFLDAIRPTIPRRSLLKVNHLLKDTLTFLKPELQSQKLSVVLELHEGVPLLELDGEQMKQVFHNLIKNASQSMSESGKLLVRTDLDDEWVYISFTDNGSGISSENIGKIFEPYFTTKESGTGLGLMIVKRIVREHGGDIEVTSNPNKGTSVTIQLPRMVRGVRYLEDHKKSPKANQ